MKNFLTKIKFAIPIVLMAVLITVTAIYYHQNFVMIIPLYVSLFVMILSSQVNRFAFLIGGLNSIIYSIVYFCYGIYGMAGFALLFSFPLQIITFVRWKKNSFNKSSVVLRKLTWKQRGLVMAGFLVAWVILYIVLIKVGAVSALWDNTATLVGVLSTFLTMLAFVEYTYISLVNGLVQIILYVDVISKSPEQTTYLFFSIYSFVCIVVQFYNARKLYQSQQTKKD